MRWQSKLKTSSFSASERTLNTLALKVQHMGCSFQLPVGIARLCELSSSRFLREWIVSPIEQLLEAPVLS